MELDRIDKRIIATLQEDGRITNHDLAAKVGLSPSACSRRVHLLEQEGVITAYSAHVNAAAVGYGTTVIVRITLERQTEDMLDRFEAAVCRAPQVMECMLMSGTSDYQIRVLVRDVTDYERLHKEILSKLPGVARIESNFALRVVVRRPSLPIALIE